jgi:hypothetical protein
MSKDKKKAPAIEKKATKSDYQSGKTEVAKKDATPALAKKKK